MHPDIASVVLKAILTASWQGSLVLLLVLLVRPLLGRKVPARWRYLLWFFVLVRLLVPSFLLPPRPASLQRISVIDRPGETMSIAWDAATGNDFTSTPEVVAAPLSHPTAPPVSTLPARPRHIAWPLVGAVIWAIGVALLGTWILGASIRLRRRMAKENRTIDPAVATIWAACCARFALSPPPRLLVVPWISSPALVGLFRATLLLPEQSVQNYTPEDWEHILMHELAHCRRRDHWTHALQLVTLCIHWFNPLVWLGFRFLRADRELAADELALERLSGADSATAYGNTLLKVLVTHSVGGFQPGIIGIIDDATQLQHRLRRIVAFGPSRLLGSCIGVFLTLAFAVIVLGRASNAPKPAEPTATPDTAAPPADTYVVSTQAERGEILDRHGKVLATNRHVANLGIVFPSLHLSDEEALAFATAQTTAAARALHRDPTPDFNQDALLRHYHTHGMLPYDIAETLTDAEQTELKKVTAPGLTVHTVSVRDYPNGMLGAHFLGYVQSARAAEPPEPRVIVAGELAGREGLEATANEHLAGTPGRTLVKFDDAGRRISETLSTLPQAGHNVVTTIDADLQSLCEKALWGATGRGAVVIIDPGNGDVLALASWPSFDPNQFIPSISQANWAKLMNDPAIPLIDRACHGTYPPGATFKPFVSIAALASGAVQLDEKIPSPPSLQIDEHLFRDWKNTDRGMLTCAEALAQNADTWFYQAGLKTGTKPIIDWALKFGFSRQTGLPLPGESAGLIPTNEVIKQKLHKDWADLPGSYLANLATGRGYTTVTPVQMAQAMATLANDGTSHPPRLLKEVQDSAGLLLGEFPQSSAAQLDIKPEILSALKRALVAAVHDKGNAAHTAAIDGLDIAGSTASVQWTGGNDPHTAGWFTGFAPANHPKYAFAALCEGDGDPQASGGANAAPMVGKILRALFNSDAK